jgi:4'-phosphopantetheinyl transferase
MTLPQIKVTTVALAEVPERLWPALSEVLSEGERSRALKFHFLRNQREYVAAHALTRLLISASRGGNASCLTIGTGDHGKPFVADGNGPHFNLSHCDGLVACAISPHVAVGLDIEPSIRKASLEVGDRFFAPAEKASLAALPAAARPARFRALWTLKEAFIKATGIGLSQGLHSFAMHFHPIRVTFPDDGADPKTTDSNWHFHQQTTATRHTLAVAWCGMAAEVSVVDGNLSHLLDRFGPRLNGNSCATKSLRLGGFT